ncbi:BT0820 family HAD-type phosphatase [Bacteroides thetaiotaomicron]|uniref:BT0820 family HAD-type phosphatase n=1 Tax=Bacteroides thetaiotaomicron TaxID=818 RepID=UPI0039C194FD
MTIAVDFDGTIVEHRYPRIGEEIPFAVETLKLLQQEKHRLILWSVREGELLDEAVEWCRARGLEFYAANKDYPEEERDHQGFSRKLKADLFIDDRNVGGIPDWGIIYEMIKEKKTFADIYSQQREENTSQKKKKKMVAVLISDAKDQTYIH